MSTFSNINISIGKVINTVNTIADLRNYKPRSIHDGDIVLVSGYSSAGDQDSGAYVWVEGAKALDDGSTTIRPVLVNGTGRWVKMFGQGDQGIKGDKGDTGLKGDQGFKGDRGDAGPPSNNTANADTLAAANPVAGDRYNVSSLFGTFTFQSGDYSAQVALDSRKVMFVKAAGIPATIGAWVRDYYDALDVRWYGAVVGGDCSAAVDYLRRFGIAIYIPAGTWNNIGSINLTGDGMRVFGDGTKTKINTVSGNAGIYINDGTNCHVHDLWLHQNDTKFTYGQIQAFHTTTRNVIIERIKMTQTPGQTNPAAASNSIKLVYDNSPDVADGRPGLDGCIIRDCQMFNVGRMGIEIQNHGPKTGAATAEADIVLRYRNILIENCLIEDAGIVDGGGAGMGVSYTGPGENVVMQNCIIRRARGPSVEMIGCHRSSMLHNTIDSPMGDIFSCANNTIMKDCVIAHNKTVGTPSPYGCAIFSFDRLNFHDNQLAMNGGLVVRAVNSKFHNNIVRSLAGGAMGFEAAKSNVVANNTLYFQPNAFAINLYYDTTTDNVVHSNTFVRPDSADLSNTDNFYVSSAPRSTFYNNTLRNKDGQFVQVPAKFYPLPGSVVPLSNYGGENGALEFNGFTGANNYQIQFTGNTGQPYTTFEILYATRQDDGASGGHVMVHYGNYNQPSYGPLVYQMGTVNSASATSDGNGGAIVSTTSTPQVTVSNSFANGVLTTVFNLPGSGGAGRQINVRVRGSNQESLKNFKIGPA